MLKQLDVNLEPKLPSVTKGKRFNTIRSGLISDEYALPSYNLEKKKRFATKDFSRAERTLGDKSCLERLLRTAIGAVEHWLFFVNRKLTK